jgi:hypothetical protein
MSNVPQPSAAGMTPGVSGLIVMMGFPAMAGTANASSKRANFDTRWNCFIGFILSDTFASGVCVSMSRRCSSERRGRVHRKLSHSCKQRRREKGTWIRLVIPKSGQRKGSFRMGGWRNIPISPTTAGSTFCKMSPTTPATNSEMPTSTSDSKIQTRKSRN